MKKIKKVNWEMVYEGFYTLWAVETPEGRREAVEASDSVAVLLYTWRYPYGKIVLVRQFRPVMTLRGDRPDGIVTELVAGRRDKPMSVRELMAAEIKEETGITVDPWKIELIGEGELPLCVSAGLTTECTHLGLVEISESELPDTSKTFGLEKEGEKIKVVVEEFIISDLTTKTYGDLRVMAMLRHLAVKLLMERKGR